MTSEDFFFKYVALYEIYHSMERLTFDPWLDFFKVISHENWYPLI